MIDVQDFIPAAPGYAMNAIQEQALALFRQLSLEEQTTYLCDLQAHVNKKAHASAPPATAAEIT